MWGRGAGGVIQRPKETLNHADDNALRCWLVDEAGKLPMHSNFRNILMSLLTLVRFSTGEGFIEIMHRSSFLTYIIFIYIYRDIYIHTYTYIAQRERQRERDRERETEIMHRSSLSHISFTGARALPLRPSFVMG